MEEKVCKIDKEKNKDKEKEVFRLTPTIGKHYEHTECTRREGKWPSEKYYAPAQKVIYVGKLTKIEEGGYGDNSWRTDTFSKANKITIVPYSYAGNTCFIEVFPEKYKVAHLGIYIQAKTFRKKFPSTNKVLADQYLNKFIQEFLY